MKKFTALMSAVMLAVCAVPMGANAENLMGDMNSNGVIDEEDGNLLFRYWQWGQRNDIYSDEYHKFYTTYGDFSGDGKIDYDDIVLFDKTYTDSDITVNTEMGDVNHDGFINAVDSTLVLAFFTDMSTGREDNYTEEQCENLIKYGDMNGDGAVNALDSVLILTNYRKKYMGDVNQDGAVDAIDSTMVLMYYCDLSTGCKDKYTEAQHDRFRMYGDMNGDGYVDVIDATFILQTYAERATAHSE